MSPRPIRILAGLLLLAVGPVSAGQEAFTTGPLIEDHGPVARVEVTRAMPADAEFRIAFDVSDGAGEGELNHSLTSAARFLNMHVASGVPVENLHLALVIHGSAVGDVATATAGPNADLVAALRRHNVELIVCGQSAAFRDVGAADLLPGVEMALSAMTAHALLQQDGYTLNPF